MHLIRGLHNLQHSACAPLAQGAAVTIGNFDGVHRGHQHVLAALKQAARQRNLPTVVMLFEPHPIEFFAPDKAPVRLMNLREKVEALAEQGVDYALMVRFDAAFAGLSAEQFVQTILVDQLHIRFVSVGDDFRFGAGRRGDFQLLQALGAQAGFEVAHQPTFTLNGERVSSTRIRAALQKPDLREAERLQGRPFGFTGRVIHGHKRGRQLGFPTLNINPRRQRMPVEGVFAVRVDIAETGERDLPGVANIGVRPTVDGLRPSIEVHVFDWAKMVYGAHVRVKLAQFIRPEQKFSDLDALRAQIAQDAEAARILLNLNPTKEHHG
ncbi:FMN adenylyltransferase /riboflavin kinase [Sulfurivirga caldicuralii]|uniref:Riboflavin biosynthesis protein n=1 Tax=Sulfurivirga caldicuralii TaxID=364032 RepID=A0A1N6GKH9_9GAMM|nr:bifunctional riboflavin kinase/FAD synthetase [Sulfurivirga caldicuralii]SIO07997.1 FMN adenylyltransferase /riboflavin kinase [Sulfurivirga caldicuralii]